MDQRDRAEKFLHKNSQTNLNYWGIIHHCYMELSSCQNNFKESSNYSDNKLNLAQELSVANVQLTIDHTRSALRKALYSPNSVTANNAVSSFQRTNSLASNAQKLFKKSSKSTINSVNNISTGQIFKTAGSLNNSNIISMSASLSSSSQASVKRKSQSSTSVNVSQVVSSRSQLLNSKVSSILTQPTSDSNVDNNVMPIKVKYYDIDSNKLVKKGLATGGYDQMINVTDLVPLPKGYRPYFYQKLYYNVTPHAQTAVVFVTDHKINLKATDQHQLIHNKNNSPRIKSSSLIAVHRSQDHYLTAHDFRHSSLWYLLIKKDLFTHSQKNLNKTNRKKQLINGEIIQIKQLIKYKGKTIAILPDGQYITARKDFVTVFKI